MKSILMAIMAVAVAVTFSAPSFAAEEKKAEKKDEKKGGHCHCHDCHQDALHNMSPPLNVSVNVTGPSHRASGGHHIENKPCCQSLISFLLMECRQSPRPFRPASRLCYNAPQGEKLGHMAFSQSKYIIVSTASSRLSSAFGRKESIRRLMPF